ncbi:MAG: NUDIX hydrolase [Chloroflexi bacterium]|nr:NUDIX hydrolase [Chloroflexota bacterium]
MQPWKTLARRTILNHSKFLTVEDHTVELPDGRVIENWSRVILPDYACIVASDDRSQFIFFRQCKYAIEGLTLAPAGGYLEPGEDPLVGAQRELLEETGFVARTWISLGAYPVDANRGCGTANFFLALGVQQIQDRHADDLEEQAVVWLTRAQVEEALAAGEFKELAWVAIVALALRRLDELDCLP